MSREAFEKWLLNSVFQHIGVEDKKFASDVWQAACEYQRESDARLCDAKATVMWAWWNSRADPTDQGRALAAEYLSEEIRSNKGE